MIKIKNNKGLTMIVLIVTIIVMLIIAGITINLGTDTIDETVKSQEKSELLMVQNAIQKIYIRYQETNDISILLGTDCSKPSSANGLTETTLSYKRLSSSELQNLGLTKSTPESITNDGHGEKIVNEESITDTFIVNYENGYVEKIGSNEPPLLGYNYNQNGQTSSVIEP